MCGDGEQKHTLAIWAVDQIEVKPHHLGASGIGSLSCMESVLCYQLLCKCPKDGLRIFGLTIQDKNAVRRM